MALTIGELVGYLHLNDRDWNATLQKAHKGLNRLGSAVDGMRLSLGAAVVTSQLAELAAAAAPAAGALLALPAAGAAAAAAMSTVQLATQGMGAAMAAVAEGDAAALAKAMQELSPAAQSFVKAIQAIKPAWSSLQQQLQQNLFQGLGAAVERVATANLPVLEQGLGQIALAFNGLAKAAADVMASPAFQGVLSTVLGDTAGAVTALQGAVGPLVAILGTLVTLGSPLIEQFAKWITQQAQLAAGWVTSAQGMATLQRWLRRGIATLRQLAAIGANVGRIIGGIFAAANQGGGSFLRTLRRMTAQMAAWVNSARGQRQIATLFMLLSQVAGKVSLILGVIARVTLRLISLFNMLPAPVQQVVTTFLALGLVFGSTITKAVRVGLAIARLSRKSKLLKAVGRGFASVGKAAGKAAGKTAKAVGRMLARYAVLAARSLVYAARVAASWFIAMGPVGWIIAAVIGLVALIIANWDRVWKWTQKAWSWVWSKIKWVWDKIVAGVGWAVGKVMDIVGWFASLPSKIGRWWDQAKVAAITAAIALWNWMTSLPGKILGALGDLGSLLWNAGQAIIEGLINGIQSAVDWLLDKLDWVTSLIPEWKGPLSEDRKLLQPAGQAIMQGLIAGIEGQRGRLRSTLRGVTGDINAGGQLGAPALPGAEPAAGAGSLVNIENYHAGAQSERRVAEDLWWLTRARG